MMRINNLRECGRLLLLAGVLVGAGCSTENGGGGFGFDGGFGDGSGLTGGTQSTGGTGVTGGAGGTGAVAGTGGAGGMPMGGMSMIRVCMSDNQCTAFGQLCDTKRERCVGCLNNTQCKTDERCTNGECIKVSPCKNSLECAGLPNQNICDTAAGECVQCAQAADCPMNNDCSGSKCVAYTPCKTSLDCPQGTVCEPNAGRCYQCTRDADCGTNRVCAGNTCRTACQSDNQCTTIGLLCNVAGGFCADCIKDDNCPDTQHCASGSCRNDVCRPGASSCNANVVQTCNAAGSGYEPPRPCATRQTCVAEGGVASCKNWACTADSIYCDNRSVVTCSKDGLREIARVDCSQSQQYCNAGACGDRICNPNSRHCYMDDVYSCDGSGLVRSLYQTCSDTTQYCNDSTGTATCSSRLCTPGAPACNGGTATTCNATGSGYVSGGTDCAATNKVCSSGTCKPGTSDLTTASAASSNGTTTWYTNKYLVSTSRTLIGFEVYLRPLTDGQTFYWAVYEGLTDTGTYNRIWAKTESPIATQANPQWYASGDINVPLVAGRYYVIGVDPSSTTYQHYESTAAFPHALSFGTVLGYVSGSATSTSYTFSTASASRLYAHKLLTTAP